MEKPDFSKWKDDPRPIQELIHLALSETDENAAWEPVATLHFRGTREVLDAAADLCHSGIAEERRLGANILGQLGVPDRSFPNRCFDCLSSMLRGEKDPSVLNAIGVAFGHLRDPRSIDLLLPLVNHPDSDVRFGVVQGMSCQDHARAIGALIKLSADEDTDVRDWATFGLGTLSEFDSPELRDALIARLSDDDSDTFFEALVGLARRKDARALEPLLESLSKESISDLALEAACELAHPSLLPALLNLKKRLESKRNSVAADLDRAITACQKSPVP